MFLLANLRQAAGGFSKADRQLRGLERALKAVQRGEATIGTDVDTRLLDAVARVRALVLTWLRTGRGRKQLDREAKYILNKLKKRPPVKRELCSFCQEKLPFLGGREEGGICGDCIREAHRLLVEQVGVQSSGPAGSESP
jgi:hypothetical protein